MRDRRDRRPRLLLVVDQVAPSSKPLVVLARFRSENPAYEDSSPTKEQRPGDEAPPSETSSGENVCPVCEGSGEKDGSQCPNCEGAGRVNEAISGG
jgi:hypothetical protein